MNKFESLVINKAEEKINQEFRLKNIDVIKNYFIKEVKKKKKKELIKKEHQILQDFGVY